MPRKLWWVGLLLVLLLVGTVSTAFAQDVNGDKIILGRSFVLVSGQVLRGNLAVLGGDITLEDGSRVSGDVLLLGGGLRVSGTVDGSAIVLGGNVELTDSARIRGDLAHYGGTLQRAPGAEVQGDVFNGAGRSVGPLVPPMPPIRIYPRAQPGGLGKIIGWEVGTAAWVLFLVLLGLVAVAVAPRGMARIADGARRQTALSFGLGLLTLVVAVLAGGLLLIACGLGLLVWLAAVIAFLVGWLAVGLWLGQRLLQAMKIHERSSLGEMALGVFLITVLSRLPLCIGFLATVIVGSVGLGAVVLSRFGTQTVEGAPGWPSGGAGRPPIPPVPPVVPPASSAIVPVETGMPPAVAPEERLAGEPVVVEAPPAVAPQPVAPVETFEEQAPQVGEIPAERLARMEGLEAIAGLGPLDAERLGAAGIRTLADLASTTSEQLAAYTGVPVERIVSDDWIGQARRHLGQ